MTAGDLVRATGGRLLRSSDRPIRGGAVDSRLVTRGGLFRRAAGRADGRPSVPRAGRRARAPPRSSSSREPADGEAALADLGDVTVVLVPDALRGLHAAAAAWRRRFSPLVVGVTGSIAKTSTKEAVAGVLERRYATLRTEGNRNNEVGLPLTVLDLGPAHGAAVLEMGMYTGGEIRELAAIGQPSIGIVTAVQPVHLSRIGTLDAIEDAKAELVEALPAAADGGIAILNADDPARPPYGLAHARARDYLRVRARTRTCAPWTSRPPGSRGCAFRLVTPGGDRDGRDPRRSAGSRSTTRWRRGRRGWPRACRSTRSCPGSPPGRAPSTARSCSAPAAW